MSRRRRVPMFPTAETTLVRGGQRIVRVSLLEDLPSGSYRAVLSITRIRRRRGVERPELALERVIDFKVRKPRERPTATLNLPARSRFVLRNPRRKGTP